MPNIEWNTNPNIYNVIYIIEFYGYSQDIFSNGNQLVARYVGQTTQLLRNRVEQHIKKKHTAINEYLRYHTIRTIKVSAIPTPTSDLNRVEQEFIHKYEKSDILLLNRQRYKKSIDK